MRRKSLALIALAAVSAIWAGSAQGAATTTAAEVYTGSSPGTTLTSPETLKGALKSGSTFVFESKVGTGETPVRLVATGAECKACIIENKEITSKAGKVAFGTGKILFTGVTVTTQANCKVPGGLIESNALNAHGDFMNGTTAVARVLPVAGEGKSFVTFEIEGNGGTCSVSGLYSVTGTLFVDWGMTGTFSATHSAHLSPASLSADGGGLFIGSKPVQSTGTLEASLGSGKEWTIK